MSFSVYFFCIIFVHGSALGEKPDEDLIKEFDEFVAENKPYTQLCLGDKLIGPAGVRCIVDGICGTFHVEGMAYLQLTNLHLWNCGAGSAGATACVRLDTLIPRERSQLFHSSFPFC